MADKVEKVKDVVAEIIPAVVPAVIVQKQESVKARIVQISNEIRIKKDGRNDFGKYDYFTPETLVASLNPLLLKYRLITLFNLVNDDANPMKYHAELTIEDFDSDDSVDYFFDIDRPVDMKGANTTQVGGSTLTYAKRYSLMNAFNITDNKDDPDSKPPEVAKPEVDPEVQKIINEIAGFVKVLTERKITSEKISDTVKNSNGGVANYKKVKDLEIAKIILSELKKL